MMPKYKVVATDAVVLASALMTERRWLHCPDGKIVSVCGVLFEDIPPIHGTSLFGRSIYQFAVSVRSNLTINDFEIEIINAP